MSEKVIDFIRSAEQKETLLSKELTFYMKRKIICQSRAEQSSFCDTTFMDGDIYYETKKKL